MGATVKDNGLTGQFILVSQDEKKPFNTLEYLCVLKRNIETACGFVTKATPYEAIVHLEFRTFPISVGEEVIRSQKHPPCVAEAPFAPPNKKEEESLFIRKCTEEEQAASGTLFPSYKYLFGMGLNGTSPRIETNMRIGEKWSLGLRLELIPFKYVPTYRASVSGTGYGGQILITYYLDNLFRGFFIQTGLGLTKGRLKLRGQLDNWTSTTWPFAVGYRYSGYEGFGITFSGGGYYFSFSPENPSNSTTYLTLPTIALQFDVAF